MTRGPYRVRLDVFEGPLDLLLHLCRRQEVDVRDIPIATVTEQYLDYLELMQQLDLEVAGSYLAMAATLCHVKSLVLLPRAPAGDGGDEGPDPREDLIRRLLEYQRYREAADALTGREILDRDTFGPHRPPEARNGGERPVDGSLFGLLDALRELLEERRHVPGDHTVHVDRFSIADRMRVVVGRMALRRRMEFRELFDVQATREEILVTFLALLEMVRLEIVALHQGGHLEPIELELIYDGDPEDLPIPGEEEHT